MFFNLRNVSKLFLILYGSIFVYGPGVVIVLALLMQVHIYICIVSIYLFEGKGVNM